MYANWLKREYRLSKEEFSELELAKRKRVEKENEFLKRINIAKAKSILECCTGVGEFAQRFVKMLKPQQNFFSLERDFPVLKNLKKKNQKLCLVNADLWQLPFKSNCFDLIISHYTLHSLRSKERNFKVPFSEMVRVLKKGGRLVVMDFYYDGKTKTFLILRHKFIQFQSKDEGIKGLGIKPFEVYLRYLKDAGLKNFHYEVVNFNNASPFYEKVKKKINVGDFKKRKTEVRKFKNEDLKLKGERIIKEMEKVLKEKKNYPEQILFLWGKK
jgi:ubiquinone/menaquinone biosynthesis C-methylase UbiE